MVACSVCITNCTVYYVLPDDDHRITSNHTNTLRHYLINSENHFTSHTQFIFLPGKHHLHKMLLVKSVLNITLQGISPQKMYTTTIYCTSRAHVSIIDSENVNIKYLNIKECGHFGTNGACIALDIFNSSNVVVTIFLITCKFHQCGLAVINAFNSVQLLNVTSSHLMIAHNRTRSNSNVTICDYQHIRHPIFSQNAIIIFLKQNSNDIIIQLSNITLKEDKAITIICLLSTGKTIITFARIIVFGLLIKEEVIVVSTSDHFYDYNNNQMTAMIIFRQCHFENIRSEIQNNVPTLFTIIEKHSYQSYLFLSIIISSCNFANISSALLFKTHLETNIVSPTSTLLLQISNSSFSVIEDTTFVILIEGAHLVLEGPVTFTEIKSEMSIIQIVKGAISLFGEITFSFNQAYACIVIDYITIFENTMLNVTANNFSVVFCTESVFAKANVNTLCTFQYSTKKTSIIQRDDQPAHKVQNYNYSILLQYNNGKFVSNRRHAFSHCDWISDSVFIQSDPFEINQRTVHIVNNSMALEWTNPSSICYCINDQHYNCSSDELGPVYPGQT